MGKGTVQKLLLFVDYHDAISNGEVHFVRSEKHEVFFGSVGLSRRYGVTGNCEITNIS